MWETELIIPDNILFMTRRYKDKSSAKQKLDTFLEHAYTEQIKELNGTTGM